MTLVELDCLLLVARTAVRVFELRLVAQVSHSIEVVLFAHVIYSRCYYYNNQAH